MAWMVGLACVALGAALSAPPAVVPHDGAEMRVARTDGKRFWVKDKHHYTSPWYKGVHRKMIGFGCTRAPYYDPDPRCKKRRGYHHGLDIAMRCGNPLKAGLRGRVKDPDAPGSLGSAYGSTAFRLHNERFDIDIVIGHVRRALVESGDRVRRGDRIARAGKRGAPDGCHLHFEVRPENGSYTEAIRPGPYLRLKRAD